MELKSLAPADLKRAAEAALLAAEKDAPAPDQWPRLTRLASGSVRRALQLYANGGLDLYGEIVGLLGLLPKVDWPAAHTLSDSMAQVAQEQRFAAFFDLLLEMLARLVHVRTTGSGEGDEIALAQRLIKPDALPRWAETWETLVRERSEAEALNLDRKSLVLGAIARLEAAARG